MLARVVPLNLSSEIANRPNLFVDVVSRPSSYMRRFITDWYPWYPYLVNTIADPQTFPLLNNFRLIHLSFLNFLYLVERVMFTCSRISHDTCVIPVEAVRLISSDRIFIRFFRLVNTC
ncbi:hypothetical protein CRM22_002837 [Opisthorchis felineus]|uniref:Uncharacterized protein n=1 Tax=Opisthorchis felineus TaxID=147828 RepID=A0A4S2M4N3_OPIFE|nr:hypothetical protein CRM22_002837 [Opisthorchis felineus]